MEGLMAPVGLIVLFGWVVIWLVTAVVLVGSDGGCVKTAELEEGPI